jgi:hypothetical protein
MIIMLGVCRTIARNDVVGNNYIPKTPFNFT